MIFGLFYFCVVILCVNRLRSSFILYRIVKRHSRQSNVRRIWTCTDNDCIHCSTKMKLLWTLVIHAVKNNACNNIEAAAATLEVAFPIAYFN